MKQTALLARTQARWANGACVTNGKTRLAKQKKANAARAPSAAICRGIGVNAG